MFSYCEHFFIVINLPMPIFTHIFGHCMCMQHKIQIKFIYSFIYHNNHGTVFLI